MDRLDNGTLVGECREHRIDNLRIELLAQAASDHVKRSMGRCKVDVARQGQKGQEHVLDVADSRKFRR